MIIFRRWATSKDYVARPFVRYTYVPTMFLPKAHFFYKYIAASSFNSVFNSMVEILILNTSI